MKKALSTLTFILCFYSLIEAQDWKKNYTKVGDNASEGMYPVMDKNYRWGYVDEKTGTEIVAPKYDKVYGFSEGLSCVSLNDKFGFIDKTGKGVIPLMYNDAKGLFKNGMAAVNKGAARNTHMGLSGGLWGFINKENKTVIGFMYDDINPFFTDLIAMRKAGLWGFIDITGKEVIKPTYKEIQNFSEGFASGRRSLTTAEIDSSMRNFDNSVRSEGWTFFNKTGKEIIKPKYSYLYAPADGLLLATVSISGTYGNKYGFLDKTGKVAIPFELDGAYRFSEGWAPVYSKEKTKWGYIDKKGKLVIPYKYTYAYPFIKGVGSVTIDNIKYTIDKSGKETPVVKGQ